jgi:parallel beta-helix repeat protein
MGKSMDRVGFPVLCIIGIIVLSSLGFATDPLVPSVYPTIGAGITAAVEGDTVIVAPGTYTGDANTNRNFQGKAITVRSIDPDDPGIVATTIIDCENTYLSGFSFSNDADSTIAGFTIINGSHGIMCDQSSPAIINCVISGNNARVFNGGGIRCINNSSPTITHCTVTGNSATDMEHFDPHGAGISCEGNSNPLITNCIISDNIAGGNKGGGIYSFQSNPTFKNCVISGNLAGDGGGFYNDESLPTVSNCIIVNNQAGDGGGIYGLYGGGIINCTVVGNTASRGGGIFCRSLSFFEVDNCILRGNTPNQIGGDEPGWADGTPVRYTNIEGGWTGIGNIDVDSYFADVDDFHLKSQAGRWTDLGWVIDAVTSPCIDAGDPGSAIGLEPFANGGRVNMGAYGGTAEASKSYFGTAPCETIMAGDINGDCSIDLLDFVILAGHWLWQE